MSYRSYADDYIRDRKSEIENITSSTKYDTIQKLNFLLREEIKEEICLNPSQEICNTTLKTQLLYYLNANSYVKYLDSSKSDKDFKKTLLDWEKNKSRMLDTAKTTVKTFIADNEDIIPKEIQYCLRKKETKKLNEISKEQLAGTIIGMLEVREYLKEEINHTIRESAIHENMHQELKALLQNKISWDSDVNTIGFMARKLMNGYVSYPNRNSRNKIAQLISAHFNIKGNEGRYADIRSIVNAISKADKLKIDIHTKLIAALQYSPKKIKP
jgi:hypothetical protein